MLGSFNNSREMFMNANRVIIGDEFSIENDISTGDREISFIRGNQYSYRQSGKFHPIVASSPRDPLDPSFIPDLCVYPAKIYLTNFLRLRKNQKRLDSIIDSIAKENPNAKIGTNRSRHPDSHRLYAEFRAKLPEIDFSPPEVYELFVKKLQRKYQNEKQRIQRAVRGENSNEKPGACAKCVVKAANRDSVFVNFNSAVAESNEFKRFQNESPNRVREILCGAYANQSDGLNYPEPNDRHSPVLETIDNRRPQEPTPDKRILFQRMFGKGDSGETEALEKSARNPREDSAISKLGIQPWLAESSLFLELISHLQENPESAQEKLKKFCEVSSYDKFRRSRKQLIL